MATISRPCRSGGKMVRARRTTGPRNPYERPPRLLPNSGLQNPNWLSKLISSPSRLIATGAGKVFSSVFGPDSSSSSSSSNGDSTSEDEMDDVNGDNDMASQSAERIEKKKTSNMINPSSEDPQLVGWKNETKRVIEQLVMQETFSREECSRLTQIIRSRVVDSPTTEGSNDKRLDVDIPDLHSTAVTEAKKWLEEKKLGSNSKSGLEYGTCTLNTAMLPHAIEDEVGSPVDVAKSYMQARPQWASPSMEHVQLNSPSPMGIQLFKEATPYSLGGNSVSSSKLNKVSPITGSWNILEELRKVRSKATEEMLRTRSSSKIDWSAVASGCKGGPNSLEADKIEVGIEDKLPSSTQLVDVPLKWGNSITTNGFKDLQMAQDGLQNEAFPPIATSIPEQSQDVGSTPTVDKRAGLWDGSEGVLDYGQLLQPLEDVNAVSQSDAVAVDGPKSIDEASQLVSFVVGGMVQDSRQLEINCSPTKNVAERGKADAANGFPTPGSSLSGGQEKEQKSMPYEEHNAVCSDHDKMTITAPVNATCALLSEASVEVPVVNEDESIATGSQNSSSTQHEELSQDLSRSNSKRRLASKISSATEKQQGRKLSRYNRKGRGRGK